MLLAQSERDQTYRILSPMAWQIAREIIDANARLGDLRTIIETHREDGCSRSMSQIDPVCFLVLVADGSQILREIVVESCRLRWEQRRQSIACGLGDRRVYGHWARRGMRTGVTADDRVERVEHCDVHNRHGPAGTPRSELFTKNAVLSRGDRSMIETAGINRDQVPTVKRIESVPRTHKRRNMGSGMKQWPKRRSKPIIQNGGKGQNRQHQPREQDQKSFHTVSRGVFTWLLCPLPRTFFPG
jgi:hypothetical protein